jgi:hypothetical protein
MLSVYIYIAGIVCLGGILRDQTGLHRTVATPTPHHSELLRGRPMQLTVPAYPPRRHRARLLSLAAQWSGVLIYLSAVGWRSTEGASVTAYMRLRQDRMTVTSWTGRWVLYGGHDMGCAMHTSIG